MWITYRSAHTLSTTALAIRSLQSITAQKPVVLVLKRNLWSVSFFLQILLNNLKKIPWLQLQVKDNLFCLIYTVHSDTLIPENEQMSVVLVRIPLYELSSTVTLAHHNTLWLILSNLTLYNTKLQGQPTSSLSELLTSTVLKKETENWSF